MEINCKKNTLKINGQARILILYKKVSGKINGIWGQGHGKMKE